GAAAQGVERSQRACPGRLDFGRLFATAIAAARRRPGPRRGPQRPARDALRAHRSGIDAALRVGGDAFGAERAGAGPGRGDAQRIGDEGFHLAGPGAADMGALHEAAADAALRVGDVERVGALVDIEAGRLAEMRPYRQELAVL